MRRGGVHALVAAGCVVASFAAAGCGLTSQHDNLVNGKQQFASKCGTCHTLARADTKGTTGPNLDEAFQRARKDGFKNSTFAGIVAGQIRHPSRLPQVDPATKKELPLMPPDLVKGDDVTDVAAYVGMVAGAGGKDTGRLAQAGAKAEGTAKETSSGVLDIPVNKAGGLLFQYADATASAGNVTIESKNDETIGHNIAVEGNGVNKAGEVVQGGATSKIEVDLKPGTYTFFCSVPGHREGGMEGKLTVK
jgi:plastocyanin